MSSSKRSRSVNWDEEEKQLLRSVLKEYAGIIEDKSLDTNTNKNKTKAWKDVLKKFNALNRRQRELSQLKIQWKGMKVTARKTFSTYKQELNKTGGGARPVTPDDAIIEVIDLLNPAELLIDDNPFDSDELDCRVITIEEVDIKTEAQKTPSGVPKRKLNYKNITDRPEPDRVSKFSKNLDYDNALVSHSKILKEKEHARRMEMAEEEHKMNMKIKQGQLNCVILEEKILELRMVREEKLSEII